MDNKGLKQKYNEMHAKGQESWFSDGQEERETIIRMGEPWEGLRVLEIGCGEGDLAAMVSEKAAYVFGVDYVSKAINRAFQKHDYGHRLGFADMGYKTLAPPVYRVDYDVLVMQGVLEHLDDPFTELQWMIDHFKPKTVITSSPCFLNTRGIVWMVLDMLGAVMSKTDLHFLHPWQFEEFCQKHGYGFPQMSACDYSWGWSHDMIKDLKQRIPLALKDGGLDSSKADAFIEWLKAADIGSQLGQESEPIGATMVYRIEV